MYAPKTNETDSIMRLLVKKNEARTGKALKIESNLKTGNH